jgi:hypothetical protein
VRPEKADRTNDTEGLNSMETKLAYTEQQREVTITDILLLWGWHDLAKNKRKEAQK